MNKKIDQNYFTGEGSISMSATLGEVEVLNSAGDNVKELASSGALSSIHERCDSLKEASERSYVNTRDKIESVIQAIQTKEDDVYETLIDEFELTSIKSHEDYGNSLINSMLKFEGMASVENLVALDAAIGKCAAEDKSRLEELKTQLTALLAVKAQAMDQLIALQESYNQYVEPGDAAGVNDLANFQKQNERYRKAISSQAESESSKLLESQIAEISEGIENVKTAFSEYASAVEERTQIFSNFTNTQNDHLDVFRNELLVHLSQEIVVKENRQRYQKEQFERLLIASQLPLLKNQKSTMETFCQDYCKLIE